MKTGALRLIVSGLLSLAVANAAQSGVPTSSGKGLGQPSFAFEPEKLRGICNDVYGKIEDKTNREEWSYAYERKVYEAAGVNFKTDTAVSAREKIRSLWLNYRDAFRCDGGDFDVNNGNILKYAMTVRTYDFVDNAVKVWGVDLNIVDDSDGKSLLDYVDHLSEYSVGTELETVLARYQAMLVRYGAKHCHDLADTSKCK